MKKIKEYGFLALVLVLSLVVIHDHFTVAHAQTTPSFTAPSISWTAPIANNVSQCPTFAAHTGGFCPVEATPNVISYYEWTGSGYTLMVNGGGAVSGVLTFNGHKPDNAGNIAPAIGDYSYGMITGTPANPVLTVNGHPGPNVTLGATSTAPTTTIQ